MLFLWPFLVIQWYSLCTAGNLLHDRGAVKDPDLYFSLWLCSYPTPVLPIPHCSPKTPVSTSYSPFLFIWSGLHLDWDLLKAKALEAGWFFQYRSCLQAFGVTSTINTRESSISFAISRMCGIFLGTFW